MSDLFRSKENEFYIELSEERYYFPGDQIYGDVVLDLKKATKTNNIKVTLEGIVEFGGKNLVLFAKTTLVAESPEGDQKSYYLQPHTHRFPFKIFIPSSDSCQVPSTLEIPKLLKVSYKLTAVYNKAYSVLEKFCPSTSVFVNVLEHIDVESPQLRGEQVLQKSLRLTGETSRKVKVSAVIGKKAAVRGDIVPISVTIEHIGVMVRDKAISAKLFRSVYYGKKKELFGSKLLREVTSDINISGPFNFTKTFNLKLPIPSNISPTVDILGNVFEIQYSIRISVNLNEENPHRAETEKDIVGFISNFTVGTYPKLSFCIDGDEENPDDLLLKDSAIDASEYDRVFEQLKDLDLETQVNSPNGSCDEEDYQDTVHSYASAKAANATLNDKPTETIKTENTLQSHDHLSTKATVQDKVPAIITNESFYSPYTAEVVSPPLDKLEYSSNSATTVRDAQKDDFTAGLPLQSSPVSNRLEAVPASQFHKRSSSGVSNISTLDSVTDHTISSSASPQSTFKQAASSLTNPLHDIPVVDPAVSTSLQTHESIGVVQPSAPSPKLADQRSTQSAQQLARQESVRWVVPSPVTSSPVNEATKPNMLPPQMVETTDIQTESNYVMMPTPLVDQLLLNHNQYQPHLNYPFENSYHSEGLSVSNYQSSPQDSCSFPTPMPVSHSLSSSLYNQFQPTMSSQLHPPLNTFGSNPFPTPNYNHCDNQESNRFDNNNEYCKAAPIPQVQHYFPGRFMEMPTPQNKYPY